MGTFDQLGAFGGAIVSMLLDPWSVAIVLGASFLGIVFGALPGLTATLGVGLLATLTYGFGYQTALLALIAMYVGAIYGGSYPSILLNIPGTAASAASAMDGYPMAARGEGGRALGLTTTASFIGTLLGMVALVVLSPLIVEVALGFTSYEFCLLAIFGIIISGTLQSPDLVIKGWIAGFIGLALSVIGRDPLMFYPRYTFGLPALDSGLEVVPVLIGAFAIPQIITTIRTGAPLASRQAMGRIVPEIGTIFRNLKHIVRSAFIGVGIGAVPGVGEDIAGWVSYGAAKSTSRHPEKFGTGEPAGLISAETANNACIGGALIPLVTLGIPGSPPAVMLLGALMLHGLTPGPMLSISRPTFLAELAAVMVLASAAMCINGLVLARQVVKVLRVPSPIFLPIVAVLSVLGSYALGLNIANLYLMLIVGVAAYLLTAMRYPIAPLVIGVILGPMADENLRRALMVGQGDLTGFYTRPVSLILIAAIALTVFSQMPVIRRGLARLVTRGAAKSA
ncbi:tripartite tricarboxylate transporter permease [Acuticoccus sp. M5D2P5]|uniref:tripartite tricarboxylate transporter permease n=1 Tax=Acuticoccus kalidii TaxID=2910977 RepID=UPI001F2E99A5|nr:tripartite tricarboxylate transporter permease [Acuticoccus kalidii]MCF3936735.1 tripartite tricarboxylate transporter permease [Acuticoccus kalidii]